MAAASDSNAPHKPQPLRKGCYVQRLSKDGTRRRSSTIFECGEISASNKCQISTVFGGKPKTKRVSAAKLIPQTLIFYHRHCLKHGPLVPVRGGVHPESAERVSIPMRTLREYGLMQKCIVMKPRKATAAELLAVHS